MTWNPLWFQAYIDFEKPEAVHGIGEDAIFALGKGTVVMYDANKRPHEVHHVLYVPALRDSLISKHWTRLNGLTTTLDDEENVILSSSNGFTITTTYGQPSRDVRRSIRLRIQSLVRIRNKPTSNRIRQARTRW